jgi:Mg2+ and Co2+ transporter CorA
MAQKINPFKKARILFFLPCLNLDAAPQRGGQQYYQDPNAMAIGEIRNSLESLKHAVNNQEVEIHIFDEKLKNFDEIIESMRDQFSDAGKQQKELVKGNCASLEAKIMALETTSKGLINDLRQFKTHSNETTDLLNQYRQKFRDLETSIDQQNQNIEHLQAAMQSLMEAMHVKHQNLTPASATPVSGRTYKVKSGDSLEKIARAHQTTIQAIKQANQLTNDKIVVGKTLVIPE